MPDSTATNAASYTTRWDTIATRYDKTKESYLGFVAIAAIKLWIPFVHER